MCARVAGVTLQGFHAWQAKQRAGVDEAYFGSKAKNMHARERARRISGRGGVGKTAVLAARDRRSGGIAAKVVANTDKATLQGFVAEHVAEGAMVYTDDHRGSEGLLGHETVRHSVEPSMCGIKHT